MKMSDLSDDEKQGNNEWADSINKILKLNKPKRKRTLVLSRAKKLPNAIKSEESKSRTTNKVDFEIVGADGKIIDKEIKEDLESSRKRRKLSKIRKLPSGIRIKPSVLDLNYERSLRKTATKGVVQLFNAVKEQQRKFDKQIEESAPNECKKDDILKNFDKNSFLDLLMSGTQPQE